MISPEMRQLVRGRAGFACEYCGVTDVNTGAELTIDHYRPQSQHGTDNAENLVNCCYRCNQFKSAYWAANTSAIPLWNPRTEPAAEHFIPLRDGRLAPLTETGRQTIQTLRLNRPLLVTNRLRRRKTQRRVFLLQRNCEIIEHLTQIQRQKALTLGERLYWTQRQRAILQELLELEGDDPNE
ncbi:MAG TPA: HNH endonuclease signature motif containing protein [Blastocatellia bacterium]|nr:HNH endonuclease signature motif containing protein [Blastocatellia bacterium]